MIEKMCDFPEIYRVEVTLPNNPLRYLNSYMIKGKQRHLVIDTGFNLPECQRDLCQGMREVGIELDRTDLFLTHLHADHTGLVHLFSQAKCPIYMHGDDFDFLVQAQIGTMWKKAENHFMEEGMPEEDIKVQFSNYARAYSPKVDFLAHCVVNGQMLLLADEWFQVIHTPGHTKGQCCLYLPKQEILFTSDHILFDITPNIQQWANMKDALGKYRQSLDLIKDLPVSLALPGHRQWRRSIKERVTALQLHHDKRLEEVYQIIKMKGEITAFDIAGRMHWSMRGMTWDVFPPTQKWFAMGEALAHIEYLCCRGIIKREEDKGIYYYHL